ncbi:hypothetical protein NQ318_022364 [Aromia moschata]|uniref:Evolutionarily conserved signaling intermediate in Toll pathway, mitochondrial n=1 Tax=Aromia moschata TaxID=1265417 RepID=A0AAV8Z783_9CUCU|nr:hypothetical protein NQ318_022364 [Aromia moschata]
MFCKRLLRLVSTIHKPNNSSCYSTNFVKRLHTSATNFEEEAKNGDKQIAPKDAFQQIENKNRNTYIEMVKIFVHRDEKYRRGHVEFIYSALKNMEEFGGEQGSRGLQSPYRRSSKREIHPHKHVPSGIHALPQAAAVYNRPSGTDGGQRCHAGLRDGRFAAQHLRQQGLPFAEVLADDVLDAKVQKPLAVACTRPLPHDIFDLAKYAIERISSVDVNSVVTVYQSSDIKDSIDDTWIVSAQSKTQRRLMQEHNVKEPVYVEGNGNPINYFILRGKPKPIVDEDVDLDDVSKIKVPLFSIKPPVVKHLKVVPSVHEQEDGVIYSVCATGTSSKDSLLSWIRHLEKDGLENLGKVQIVFTLRSGTKEIVNAEDNQSDQHKKIEEN